MSAAWEARPLLEQPTREFSPGLVRQRIPAAESGIDLEYASPPFKIDDRLEAKWSARPGQDRFELRRDLRQARNPRVTPFSTSPART